MPLGEPLVIKVKFLVSILALVLFGVGLFFYMGRKSRSIGPQGTGIVDGKLRPCPDKPNCLSSSDTGSHFAEPIVLESLREAVREQLLGFLAQLPGATVVESEDGYLRVEVVSTLFKFVDDFELLLTPLGEIGTLVQIRSASRVGHSDMGVNPERVRALREYLEKFN